MTDEEGKKRHNVPRKVHGKIIDRDFLVFVFFLLLSFSFWYLNGLSKELSANINYPVRYINPPKNRVLLGSLPPKLALSIKGPGYSLIKLRLSGSRAPVVVDMSELNYMINPGSRTYNYYVLTSTLKNDFHQQLRADFEILRIQPDTLSFSFDLIESKKVPVVPDIEVITEAEFFVKGPIKTDPDSVIITGPRPVIDTVKFVRTRSRDFSGIRQTFSKNVQIDGSKIYSISEKKVKVTVNVEQFTEARLEIPVKIINVPDSIEIRLFPNVVSVHLLVAVSDYKGIFESNISALIDYSSIDPEMTEKLPVMVVNIPSYANTVRYTPQELDYIVEKKQK